MSKSKLQQVRDAIFEVMGESIACSCLSHEAMSDALDAVNDGSVKKVTDIKTVAKAVKQRIKEDTYTGKDDPGQWSPNAEAIIHCENGIDSGAYEPYFMEKWFEVSDKLGDMFCENYNAAIIGVYKT